MNRRFLLTGLAGATATAILPTVSAAAAMTMDRAKLPALMGGDYSTATSKLAARRSNNRYITAFAELEIEEQAAVAKAFGSRPGAAGMREDQAAIVDQLAQLRGTEFDMMYVAGQIKGHQELLKIHRSYARSGRDPMARGASIVGVTGIETHLAMLEGLRRSMSRRTSQLD
jgi:putative membrane protein